MAVLSFLPLLCIFCAISTLRLVSAVSSLCPSQSILFLNHLESQCPKAFSPSTPLQVDGDFLYEAMSFKQLNGTTSILFYASWCPFSRHAQSLFDVLSSMFPQITHLAVEESKVMPIIFSKYGIHSFPSILMMNRTSRIRYYGSKDLNSLVLFYKRSTGFEPIEHFVNSQSISSGADKPWFLLDGSLGELLRKEPYLIFSVLFLCLKGFLHFFPKVVARLNAFWVSCILHLNLGIFGETNHVLKRVLHVIDVKMAWSKLRRCKTRNFHNGAKSARVWATSLASVSLGESSSRDS